MKSILKRLLLIVAVSIIAYGCAAPPLPDLVWPLPPDPPKIKYITAIRSGRDVEKGSAAADLLLGASTSFSLRKPMGVFVGTDKRMLVSDTAAADVFVFDPVNQDATSLGSKGARGIFKPIGIGFDSKGRYFVADTQADQVYVLDTAGQLIGTLSPEVAFKQPSGLAIDEPHNRLYVTDTHNHHVNVFELDTLKFIKSVGRRGGEEGEFNFPSHITVDSKGKLYVVDTMNGRVQIFDPEGRFLLSFGQFGDASGMFARPKGIAVDSEGHIYVVDAAFNNVQIFDEEGQILLSFASYGGGRGQMVLPAGMAIDDEDFIYVVDSWNRRIQVFEYLGDKHKAREGKKEEKW
jgi:DNA-binding beta-propeller fold protein YncE